jgi:hypothetical protein
MDELPVNSYLDRTRMLHEFMRMMCPDMIYDKISAGVSVTQARAGKPQSQKAHRAGKPQSQKARRAAKRVTRKGSVQTNEL